MRKVCAPKIDSINYNHSSITLDDETLLLLDDMFNYLIANIKCDVDETEENYYFCFYYEAKRGSIEDVYSYEECEEYYGISTMEEYKNIWEREYPEENYWYFFEFRKVIYDNNDYYMIAINNKIILNVDPLNSRGFKQNRLELLNITYDIVKEVVEFAKNKDYNVYVNNNLDYELREGKMLLKDYWEIEPNAKKNYFEELSNIDINDFILKADNQNVDYLNLIKEMTANKYYEICKIAYEAIGRGEPNLSAKELFYKNADGRDQELKKINENSIEEFNCWYIQNYHHFDHTFEILPGHSFYRADLFVEKRNDGYYFILSGNNYWTSIKVIKIYMELIKNSIPIVLSDANLITKRLLGESYLAIISKGKMCYGYQKIFGEYLLDSIHLPKENRTLYINKIIWEEIPKLVLK